MLGLLGRPDGPHSLDELDARILLSFLEGVLREHEEGAKALSELYTPAPAARPMSRAEEIEAFLALAD